MLRNKNLADNNFPKGKLMSHWFLEPTHFDPDYLHEMQEEVLRGNFPDGKVLGIASRIALCIMVGGKAGYNLARIYVGLCHVPLRLAVLNARLDFLNGGTVLHAFCGDRPDLPIVGDEVDIAIGLWKELRRQGANVCKDMNGHFPWEIMKIDMTKSVDYIHTLQIWYAIRQLEMQQTDSFLGYSPSQTDSVLCPFEMTHLYGEWFGFLDTLNYENTLDDYPCLADDTVYDFCRKCWGANGPTIAGNDPAIVMCEDGSGYGVWLNFTCFAFLHYREDFGEIRKSDRIKCMPDPHKIYKLRSDVDLCNCNNAVATKCKSYLLDYSSVPSRNRIDRHIIIKYKDYHIATKSHDYSTDYDSYIDRVIIINKLINIEPRYAKYCYIRNFHNIVSKFFGHVQRDAKLVKLSRRAQQKAEQSRHNTQHSRHVQRVQRLQRVM